MAQKISAALKPVNCESWSITITLSSASAVCAPYWACRDRPCITSPDRLANRRCGSWPGLTLFIWRIPEAAATGWSLTWPETGFPSVASGCETLCAARVYGRFSINLAPRFQAIHPSDCHVWWISSRSRRWIRFEQPTSSISRCRRGASI